MKSMPLILELWIIDLYYKPHIVKFRLHWQTRHIPTSSPTWLRNHAVLFDFRTVVGQP